MGLQACVECPCKLFKAQSGVFFSSDLKMGIRGHSFFFSRVTFPSFPFNTDSYTNFHSLSLSVTLWSHAFTLGHAAETKQLCAYVQYHTVGHKLRAHSLTWLSFALSSFVWVDIVHFQVFSCIWIHSDLLMWLAIALCATCLVQQQYIKKSKKTNQIILPGVYHPFKQSIR